VPIVYRCKNCGYVIYVWPNGELSKHYGAPTPSEVKRLAWPICPRCLRLLERPGPDDVRLVPFSKILLSILASDGDDPRRLLRELERNGWLTRAAKYGLVTVEDGGAHLTPLGRLYVNLFRARLGNA